MYLPGVPINDLMVIGAPSDVSWPLDGGLDLFIQIYDWDRLTLSPNGSMDLDWPINLCVGIFPCSLSIFGGDEGRIVRTGRASGSITCSSTFGCGSVMFDKVKLICDGTMSDSAVLRVDGAVISVYNSSFRGCVSGVDGGVISSMRNSSVFVAFSSFQDCQSYGTGGAISMAGGVLRIGKSVFLNCTSVLGGGAIAGTNFDCSCAGLNFSTRVIVDASTFERCTSQSNGGAIFITAQKVTADVFGSSFVRCRSSTMGGAISIISGADASLFNCVFDSNIASGLGGGAIHSSQARVIIKGLESSGNQAPFGGGGVLYWAGTVSPTFLVFCAAGFFSVDGQRCDLCPAGTFQAAQSVDSCSMCPAGKYSPATGATSPDSCIVCEAGKFSSVLGANSSSICQPCVGGSYSAASASTCNLCTPGTFAAGNGITTVDSCLSCSAGKFSNISGASSSQTCTFCAAGSFAFHGASACLLCSAGKYATAIAATGLDSCISCDAGKFSSALGAWSSLACWPCDAGKYAANKYFTYHSRTSTWAEAEADCSATGGHLASIESDTENQQLLNLVQPSGNYWIGYRLGTNSGHWLWTDGSTIPYTNWMEANPKNGSFLYGCGVFISYAHTTLNNSKFAAVWPYYREQYGVFPDVGPYSSRSGLWYNYDCSNGVNWVSGFICSYRSSASCTPCEAGKYSDTVGQTSSKDCFVCPMGKFSNVSGATSCFMCVANQNSNSSESVPNLCNKGRSLSSKLSNQEFSIPYTGKQKRSIQFRGDLSPFQRDHLNKQKHSDLVQILHADYIYADIDR